MTPEASAPKTQSDELHRLIAKEPIEAETADLEAKAAALLADAEHADTAEDAPFGANGKDTGPPELDGRETRLARPQAARAQIEAETICSHEDAKRVIVTGPRS